MCPTPTSTPVTALAPEPVREAVAAAPAEAAGGAVGGDPTEAPTSVTTATAVEERSAVTTVPAAAEAPDTVITAAPAAPVELPQPETQPETAPEAQPEPPAQPVKRQSHGSLATVGLFGLCAALALGHVTEERRHAAQHRSSDVAKVAHPWQPRHAHRPAPYLPLRAVPRAAEGARGTARATHRNPSLRSGEH